MAGVRLDKWLWAARFFKTRALSTDEIGRGHVSVNGHAAKPSREVRVGDSIELRQDAMQRTIIVKETSDRRGPAPIAQALYEETPESVALRTRLRQSDGWPGPRGRLEQGRPTKRDRRQLADWNRWSVSVDAD